MANDGQIVFEVTADGRQAVADIQNITREIQQQTRNWDSSVDNSTQNMTQAMNRAFDINRVKTWGLQLAKYLIDFGKQSVEAASALSEVQNVVDTTFGASSSEIDRWSKHAIRQFGLTETKAKQFTSTLGAMMKSSGISGGEITKMSTDLAGLAADMASFYNLDFDTAFNKIRSGISGETEPLKQLGINMSVANLEAFALQQGLKKTYAEMTQGEQVALRYQYIMQATADAQGDFAKTSDGYANGLRLLESNLDSLKTNMGGFLKETLEPLVSSINSLFGEKKERTVLDDFLDIDADTERKLAQIQSTMDQANALTDVLDTIQQKTSAAMSGVASGISSLPEIPSDATNNAESLAGSLERMEGVKIEAKNVTLPDINNTKVMHYNGVATSMETIANGAKGIEESGLNAESGAVKAVAKMAESSGSIVNLGDGFIAVKQHLEELNTSKVEEKSKEFAEAVKPFEESTKEASGVSKEWLTTCEQLVKTLPGLSTIINTETGEIKGGTQAVREYVAQWGEVQAKIANIDRLQRYRTAATENKEKEDEYYVDAAKKYALAKIKGEKLLAQLNEGFYNNMRQDMQASYGVNYDMLSPEEQMRWAAKYARSWDVLDNSNEKLLSDYESAQEASDLATQTYKDQVKANEEAAEAISVYEEKLESELTTEDKAQYIYAKSMEAVQALKEKYDEASAAADEYRKTAIEETTKSLDKLTAKFKRLELPTEQDDILSTGEMASNLETQRKFLEDYRTNLETLQNSGINKDLLAELADGSEESAAYLAELAKASPEDIEEINKNYEAVQEEKKKLAEGLADANLEVDKSYQELLSTRDKFKEQLDEANKILKEDLKVTEETIDGNVKNIAAIIEGDLPLVQGAVSRLNAILADINMPSIDVPGWHTEGSFAIGTDFVPHDMIAQIHKGEGVLTAEENKVWQGIKHSGGVDYEQLGSVVRDNVRAGGNVYLDGKTVGQVISDMQGRSYKTLQRSGWQA